MTNKATTEAAVPAVDELVAASMTAHAMIDWIDLNLTLAHPSQGQHLHRAFSRQGFTSFRPVDPATGQDHDHSVRLTTPQFIARLQAPGTAADVAARLQALESAMPGGNKFAAEPQIVGVELALMVRPKSLPQDAASHRKELARLAELVYRGLAHPVSDHHVFAEAPGVWHEPKRRSRNTELLELGLSTLLIGHRDDAQGQRVYVSTNDRTYKKQRKNQRRELPRPQWSVKLEAIMKGDSVPFKNVDEMGAFDFASLTQRFFAMRKPKPGTAATGLPCLGIFSSATARRKYNPDTIADKATTELFRIALRSLTKRQRRALVSAGRRGNLDHVAPIRAPEAGTAEPTEHTTTTNTQPCIPPSENLESATHPGTTRQHPNRPNSTPPHQRRLITDIPYTHTQAKRRQESEAKRRDELESPTQQSKPTSTFHLNDNSNEQREPQRQPPARPPPRLPHDNPSADFPYTASGTTTDPKS